MKYIKTQESYELARNFDKYIVWEIRNAIVIFEILNVRFQAKLKRLKLYYDRKTHIEEMTVSNVDSEIYYKTFDDITNGLIYQSDDLNECIEYVTRLNDTKKYNL